MSVHLGGDCKLYRLGNHLTNLVTNVRDVTLNMETGEADVSTRSVDGWRSYIPSLKDATLEFAMIVNSSDPDYSAIRSAFLLGDEITLIVSDDGGQLGYYFIGYVTGFSNPQPLEDGDTVSVTVRPNRPVVYDGIDK